MAAITDLASASSVAAGDYLVISQSGTDRKVTADKFAIMTTGTWTPTVSGDSGSGASYSTQTGIYVRYGDWVLVQFNVALSSKGTLSGTVKVSLPVTPRASPTLNSVGALLIDYYTGGGVPVIQATSSLSTAAALKTAGSGSHGTIQWSELGSSSQLRGSLFYPV